MNTSATIKHTLNQRRTSGHLKQGMMLEVKLIGEGALNNVRDAVASP
jgi:hypothetical protein